MSDKPNTIILFNDVSLYITGAGSTWTPPVSEITIELRESGIPRVLIRVDPGHENGAPDNEATLTTLDLLATWLSLAQRQAADPATRASLSLSIDIGDTRQVVNLADWLMPAAGMIASASGSMSLEIELHHPVGVLDRSSAVLGNTVTTKPIDITPYNDVIKGFSAACELFGSLDRRATVSDNAAACGGKLPTTQTLQTAIQTASAQMVARARDINNTLEWTPEWPGNTPGYSEFPFQKSCLQALDVQNCIKYSVAQYATILDQRSIWSILSDALLADFQLAIVPTYWKPKLAVIPISPWANHSITVYEDTVSDISFPGVDAAPTGGVRVTWDTVGSASGVGFWLGMEQDSQFTSTIFLPNSSTVPSGRIENFPLPAWFTSAQNGATAVMMSMSAPANPGSVEYAFSTDFIGSGDVPPVQGGADTGMKGAFAESAYAIAAQLFLVKYRSQVEASVSTCLQIKSPNSKWDTGWVIPGCVVDIKTNAEKLLFRMYLQRVTHVINVTERKAYTQWAGTHCAADGVLPNGLGAGTYNPMYTGTGA